MKAKNVKQNNTSQYEALLKEYDRTRANYERAKTKEKIAKNNLKNVDKHVTKTALELIQLEYDKARYRRKLRKTEIKIMKLTLHQWTKTHEILEKEYSLTAVEKVEVPKEKTRKKKEKEVAEVKAEPKPRSRRKKEVEEVKVEPKPTPVVEITVEAPKRGRKKKEVEEVKVEPKPRGRRKKEVEEVKVEPKPTPVVEITVEAPKRGRKKKEVEEPVTEPAPSSPKRARRSSEEVQATKDALSADLKGDDFRIIEGIAYKVTQMLHNNGVKTFHQLSQLSYDSLKGLLKANRFYLVNPSTWAEQAQFAARGDFDGLKALQSQLIKGKRPQ